MLLYLLFFTEDAFSASTEHLSHTQFLNSKEIAWLQQHTAPLKVGITQIPNQVLKDEDGGYSGYSGYAIDIFKKFESLLGKKFEYVYYDTWEEVLQAGEKREIDIVFLAQRTENRLKLYNFTDVVLLQSNKIITSDRYHTETEVDSLYGKKVVVVKDSAIAEYIMFNFPQIDLLYSESEIRSLEMLIRGDADYTISEPVRIRYYIKQNNIDNLYIAGIFPYNYRLRIATRNDQPVINIILNKALEQITPAQKKALALKWGYEKEVFFDRDLLLKIAIVGLITFLCLIYFLFLNRKLNHAKEALWKINATLEYKVMEEVEKNRERELIMLHQSRFAQMGQVLNMIAHQWRQPLNRMMLINQVLLVKYQRKNGELTEEDIKEFSEKSTQQIQMMSKTIDDFRDFFKPRREKQRFFLNDVLEHLLEMIRPVFKQADITLLLEEKTEIYIEGYPNEFSQAILNILYNAKDAFLEKKDDNRQIELVLQEKEEKILLTITDNAGGIPEEIIKNIFDPYFSTKEEKNGTGIGLYMSKMIIQTHMGGRLSVRNTDEGACFEILLPKMQ